MKLLLPTLLLSLLFTSCIKDTCNKVLGDTFQSIEVIDAVITTDDRIQIILLMERLDTLPLAYFTSSRTNISKEIDTLIFTEDQIEILYKKDSSILGTNLDFVLFLDFDDRRKHIDCNHGGGNDTYSLEMNLVLDRPTLPEIVVIDFTWEETYRAGPY